MTDNAEDKTILTEEKTTSLVTTETPETISGEKDKTVEKETTTEKDGETNKDKDNKVDKSKQGAPEKYEDFKVPEGMELDKNLLEESIPVLKELNLTQEQAQKLVDLQSKYATVQAEKTAQVWKETIDKWTTDSKTDKEFGGTKLNESITVSKLALKEFGNDGFKEMLDFTGIGNHPEMIRFLFKVGKLVKEDGILHGTNNSGGSKDPAKILFPTMN